MHLRRLHRLGIIGRTRSPAVLREAVAKLGGERLKLQFFAMRSVASGDAFHRA